MLDQCDTDPVFLRFLNWLACEQALRPPPRIGIESPRPRTTYRLDGLSSSVCEQTAQSAVWGLRPQLRVSEGAWPFTPTSPWNRKGKAKHNCKPGGYRPLAG